MLKRVLALVLTVSLLGSSGCMSTHLVKNKARPHLEYDQSDQEMKEVEGQPGYYALLPATIACDVATLPFLFLIHLVGGKVSVSD